jgi:hypothetical protein
MDSHNVQTRLLDRSRLPITNHTNFYGMKFRCLHHVACVVVLDQLFIPHRERWCYWNCPRKEKHLPIWPQSCGTPPELLPRCCKVRDTDRHFLWKILTGSSFSLKFGIVPFLFLALIFGDTVHCCPMLMLLMAVI